MPSLSLLWIWQPHMSSCTRPPCRSGSCCRCSLRTRTGRRRWPACRSTSGCCNPDTCPGPGPSHSEGPRGRSLWEELALVLEHTVQIHLRMMWLYLWWMKMKMRMKMKMKRSLGRRRSSRRRSSWRSLLWWEEEVRSLCCG